MTFVSRPLFVASLWMTLAGSAFLSAQTVSVRLDDGTSAGNFLSVAHWTSGCVVTQPGTVGGKNIPVDAPCSIMLGKDSVTGEQVPLLQYLWMGGRYVTVNSDAGQLYDGTGALLSRDASLVEYKKQFKRGTVVLKKATLLSFGNVRVAPATPVTGVPPATSSDAPRLVPHGASDPTGFDIKGVKLYMSSTEAVAALEAKLGLRLEIKPVKGSMTHDDSDRPTTSSGYVSAYSSLPDTVMSPGGWVLSYGQPFVNEMRYVGKDGSLLKITFVGETVSHAFGKPEIATKVEYFGPTPPTVAQEPLLLSALHQRYGEPRFQLVWPYPAAQVANLPPVNSAMSKTIVSAVQGGSQQEVWSLESGEPLESYSPYKDLGITYPLLKTAVYDYGLYPQSFTLQASGRFFDQFIRELEAKKQQVLRDSNPGAKPVF